jgi:hypothetical protein
MYTNECVYATIMGADATDATIYRIHIKFK